MILTTVSRSELLNGRVNEHFVVVRDHQGFLGKFPLPAAVHPDHRHQPILGFPGNDVEMRRVVGSDRLLKRAGRETETPPVSRLERLEQRTVGSASRAT